MGGGEEGRGGRTHGWATQFLFGFLRLSQTLVYTHRGAVGPYVRWEIYCSHMGSQKMQIWRKSPACPDRASCQQFTLVCDNTVSSNVIGQVVTTTLQPADYCNYQTGDVVGWYHEDRGITDYDNHCQYDASTCVPGNVLFSMPHSPYHLPSDPTPVNFQQSANREYSIRATVQACTNCNNALPGGG